MENQTEQSPDPYRLTADQQQLFNRAMWIVIGIGIGWLLFADKEGYFTNVFTELLGVAGTFFVLDYWVRRRDEHQKVEELKARLIREARSSENSVAKHAVHDLREHGWLTIDIREPLLPGKRLNQANLQGAKLWRANLKRTNLEGANLQEADLTEANCQATHLAITKLQEAKMWHTQLRGADLTAGNLHRADLRWANLQEAVFIGANLQKANLARAILHKADLGYADLAGANLAGASLRGATLDNAKFDVTTVLPDARWEKGNQRFTSYWTPDTDMRRFTDPDHPDFWQPDWVKEQQEK